MAYETEFDKGPFFEIQSNTPGVHNLQPVQSMNYLVLNRTRKLCATNYCNAAF